MRGTLKGSLWPIPKLGEELVLNFELALYFGVDIRPMSVYFPGPGNSMKAVARG